MFAAQKDHARTRRTGADLSNVRREDGRRCRLRGLFMNEQQQQQPSIPVYDAHEPSEASKRATAIFDDMESKQLDNLNDAGKSLIERIATFLGVLFGLSILSNNFPPPYLKGNTPVKALLIAALIGYLLAIGAALWATQVRFYHRYTYNVTRSQAELSTMI